MAVMAALYIVLAQLAVTSVELHAWLHGHLVSEQGCVCAHHHAGDSEPADSEDASDSAKGHLCLVNVLAGGVAVFSCPAVELPEADRVEPVRCSVVGSVSRAVFCHKLARAPPMMVLS